MVAILLSAAARDLARLAPIIIGRRLLDLERRFGVFVRRSGAALPDRVRMFR
jgi:hypothetical protein